MYIASHGRIGRASSVTIASLGRIFPRRFIEQIVGGVVEIIRLISEFTREVRLQSKLW